MREAQKIKTETSMKVKVYSENPNPKEIGRIVEVLRNDGVIIYPTDSVYGYGCSLTSRKGVERLKALSGRSGDELTLLCDTIATASKYAKIENFQFAVMKAHLPGPFTFIVRAMGSIPEKLCGKRRTVGLRIPDNAIARAIAEELGNPLLTASVKLRDNDDEEYLTDPELIHERYGDRVDMVVDGGIGDSSPTTIVDISDDEAIILRHGAGDFIE